MPETFYSNNRYDPDAFIKHLGLDLPAARALARSSGKSIIEVTCEMIGIEPREFQRLLKEKINLSEVNIGMNIERRLLRISDAISKGHTLLRDMTDDELAQVITGNPKTKASDLTAEYLEGVISGAQQ